MDPVRNGAPSTPRFSVSDNPANPMRNQIDNWLAGDWVVLGTHVQHWVVALAAIALVALIVAWLERPKRTPEPSSPRLPRMISAAS